MSNQFSHIEVLGLEAIDTIVFDLGNVLIEWDPENLFRKIFDDEKEMKYFLTEICTYEWNLAQDAGRPWKEGCQLLINKYPKYEKEILAYDKRWVETLGDPIAANVALLRKLKAQGKYRLLALTNWSQEKFPTALDKFDFLHLFEGTVVSGDEKCRKPDDQIYHILFDRYDVNPATTMFIDDSPPNVKTSRRLGMRAHRFLKPAGLRRYLKAQNVVIP